MQIAPFCHQICGQQEIGTFLLDLKSYGMGKNIYKKKTIIMFNFSVSDTELRKLFSMFKRLKSNHYYDLRDIFLSVNEFNPLDQ